MRSIVILGWRDLYKDYTYSRIDRRQFLSRSAAIIVGGIRRWRWLSLARTAPCEGAVPDGAGHPSTHEDARVE